MVGLSKNCECECHLWSFIVLCGFCLLYCVKLNWPYLSITLLCLLSRLIVYAHNSNRFLSGISSLRRTSAASPQLLQTAEEVRTEMRLCLWYLRKSSVTLPLTCPLHHHHVGHIKFVPTYLKNKFIVCTLHRNLDFRNSNAAHRWTAGLFIKLRKLSLNNQWNIWYLYLCERQNPLVCIYLLKQFVFEIEISPICDDRFDLGITQPLHISQVLIAINI